MNSIQKIAFIGSGNVATHLAKAFAKKNIEITQIYSQTCDNSEVLAWQSNAKYICDLEELDLSVDLLIFAVKDDVIKILAEKILNKKPDMKVAHTSGSVGLDAFGNAPNTGILYPLQSFSKTKYISIAEVPFLITSKNESFKNELIELAKVVSVNVYEYTDEQRKHLHIAAVFVNNFSNHLFALAQEYCEKHQIDFKLLLPLIHETIYKIDSLPPKLAQTGPAIRKDNEILEKHLAFLSKEDEHLKAIYNMLTDSILKMYTTNF